MKKIYTLTTLLLLILSTSFSQAVYTITSDYTWKSNGASAFPNPCFKCTFNIADGVTLFIERNVTFQDVVFNGGKVSVKNNTVTFWTSGSAKSVFNSTDMILNQASKITASAPLEINNAEFIFNNTASIVAQYHTVLDNSRMKFLDNASMEFTGNNFDLKNGSSIIIGDGSNESEAFVKFNGGSVNLYDNGYITAANKNNYYYNWSAYKSIANNKSYNTNFNTYNCGGTGENPCSGPVVYGPVMLNSNGAFVTAVLPVKLSGFSVKLTTKTTATLNWNTNFESNASHFTIQRSIDGSNWKNTGTVKAFGNSTSVQQYQFNENITTNGVVYYRLKMVDQDGSFGYSDVKAISSTIASEVKIFPNPSSDYVHVTLAGSGSKTTVVLMNQTGQIVAQQATSNTATLASFNVQNLKPGNYLVRVITETGVTEAHKIIISHP